MKQDISCRSGLFGIEDPVHERTVVDDTPKSDLGKATSSPQVFLNELHQPPQTENEGMIRVREKRWQVFVARAAFRFEEWWRVCVPNRFGGSWAPELRITTIEERGTSEWPRQAFGLTDWLDADKLPPLGKLSLLGLTLANSIRRHYGLACLHAQSTLFPRGLLPPR